MWVDAWMGRGEGQGSGREGVGVLWVYIMLGCRICVLIAGLEYCLACVLVPCLGTCNVIPIDRGLWPCPRHCG